MKQEKDKVRKVLQRYNPIDMVYSISKNAELEAQHEQELKQEKDKVRNVLQIDNPIDMVYPIVRMLNWRQSVSNKRRN